jgi:hypothetical protein
MIIIVEQGASVAVVSIAAEARLPEVLRYEETDAGQVAVIERAAETDAAFAARVTAEHVPAGARHVVVDAAALPDVPPERWSVDWATGAITVLPDIPAADAIRAECSRRVTAALGGKRGSINSYGIALNGKVSLGILQGQPPQVALTAEEFADVQLLWAIDAWEGEMVAAREAAILSATRAIFDDASWPAQPAGLTTAWLAGF